MDVKGGKPYKVFTRKVLRIILGGELENIVWHICMNNKLHHVLNPCVEANNVNVMRMKYSKLQ